MPLVSVLVACYNAELHLESALRSALDQSLKAIEVIVIDDCSTDMSRTIVERMIYSDPRLRLVTASQNSGPAAARNMGLKEARGEWICVLDSDDLMAPQRLERMVSGARLEKADIFADNLLIFYDSYTSSPHLFLTDIEGKISVDKATYLDGTIMYGADANYGYLKPLISRSFANEKGVTYNETLRVGEDDDFILRLLLEGAKYVVCEEALYGYRKHSASTSHRLSSKAARALEHSALALEREWQNTSFALSLRRRRKAITKARAFSEFVDALKKRDILSFLTLAAANPSALTLLRMPISALWRRITSPTSSAEHVPITGRLLMRTWDEITGAAL